MKRETWRNATPTARFTVLAVVLALVFALVCAVNAFAVEGSSGSSTTAAAGASGGAGGTPPGGEMGGGSMGTPPDGAPGGTGGMSESDISGSGGESTSTPTTAALYLSNNAELETSEDAGGIKLSGSEGTDKNGQYVINGLKMTGSKYTDNGVVVTGSASNVLLKNSSITLNVDSKTNGKQTGGDAVSVDAGQLFLANDKITVKGAQRHAVAAYNSALLVVNDSTLRTTGSVGENDAKVDEPASNGALYIYGLARTNFSVGSTQTYYYNSNVISEGWGALSTDSATSGGLDLYAYNTRAVSKNGGYGAYADTDCRLWLYGSKIESGEIGVILSKTGQLTAYRGTDADETALQYKASKGATTDGKTVIAGRRNAIMAHAPDMMGSGVSAANSATITLSDTLLTTDSESKYLADTKTKEDYAGKYGDAIGAYMDYVTGADILLRSTSADITLDRVDLEPSGADMALVKTVVNCDSMGNFLLAGGSDAPDINITMTNMDVTGNIVHMDYQRNLNVFLGEGAVLYGGMTNGTVDDWNELWSDYAKDDTAVWLLDGEKYETEDHGISVTMQYGSTWNVTGTTVLETLSIENNCVINGAVYVDGKEIDPEPGEVYYDVTIEPTDESLAKLDAKLEAEEPEEESHTGLILAIVILILLALAAAGYALYRKKFAGKNPRIKSASNAEKKTDNQSKKDAKAAEWKDKTKAKAEDLKSKTKEKAEDLKPKAEELKSKTKEKADDLKSKAEAKAGEFKSKTKTPEARAEEPKTETPKSKPEKTHFSVVKPEDEDSSDDWEDVVHLPKSDD